jgi:hypothetical protein
MPFLLLHCLSCLPGVRNKKALVPCRTYFKAKRTDTKGRVRYRGTVPTQKGGRVGSPVLVSSRESTLSLSGRQELTCVIRTIEVVHFLGHAGQLLFRVDDVFQGTPVNSAGVGLGLGVG